MNRVALFLRNSYLYLFLRLFVGGTFILSAVSKFPEHTQFVDVVKDYDLLPDALATAYANALPWVEILVGVYLLLGILIRPSAVVTILLGISFMVANIRSLVRGRRAVRQLFRRYHCTTCGAGAHHRRLPSYFCCHFAAGRRQVAFHSGQVSSERG